MKSNNAQMAAGRAPQAEQLDSLCRVMDAEAGAYQALLPLLSEQRQAAVEARFEQLVNPVGDKDELLKSLRNFENQRMQLMEALSAACRIPAAELTVSRLMALSPQPAAERLNASRCRLQAAVEMVRRSSRSNQQLLRHLLELMKSSLDLLGGKEPGDRTYRENGRVQAAQSVATAQPGHISYEV